MIEWYNLFANAIWIFALALVLAMISFARWEALSQGMKLREVLSLPAWQIKLNITGGIFCIGLALTSAKTWEQALWGVMAVLFGVQIWLIAKSSDIVK